MLQPLASEIAVVGGRMLEKLKAIDIAAVKRLTELRKEQERLQGFVDKAREMKSGIDEEIFQRVVDDYHQRADALRAEAEPLKSEAREQFAVLRELLDEINGGLEDARAIKEEMEFRHKIGELTQKELAEAVSEAEATLAGREKELAAAEKLEKQFRNAFADEEDLEGSSAAPRATEGREQAEEHPADEDEADDEVASPDDSITDRTMIFNDAEDATAVMEAITQRPTDGTIQVPIGTLVEMNNGEPGQEHHLGALNYVGRSPDSHVCIDSPEVSREHALVAADVSGFVLRDLNSPNGTLVNDEKISEHPLVDGDRITIGGVELVFHAG
jgi:hypothetical protein